LNIEWSQKRKKYEIATKEMSGEINTQELMRVLITKKKIVHSHLSCLGFVDFGSKTFMFQIGEYV
jgi:hypothetical protein